MNDMNCTEMNAITTWKHVSVECTDCNSGRLFAYNVFNVLTWLYFCNKLSSILHVGERICEEWTNSTNYLLPSSNCTSSIAHEITLEIPEKCCEFIFLLFRRQIRERKKSRSINTMESVLLLKWDLCLLFVIY